MVILIDRDPSATVGKRTLGSVLQSTWSDQAFHPQLLVVLPNEKNNYESHSSNNTFRGPVQLCES